MRFGRHPCFFKSRVSAAVIARLKSEWEDEYRRWQKRDLSARHYVYVWADGVYLQARLEPHRPHEGRAVAGHRASHGVQTGDGRVQDLATIARSKPVAESRQRYKVQRRNRSCRRNQIRRLIHAVTDFSA